MALKKLIKGTSRVARKTLGKRVATKNKAEATKSALTLKRNREHKRRMDAVKKAKAQEKVNDKKEAELRQYTHLGVSFKAVGAGKRRTTKVTPPTSKAIGAKKNRKAIKKVTKKKGIAQNITESTPKERPFSVLASSPRARARLKFAVKMEKSIRNGVRNASNKKKLKELDAFIRREMRK